jgi:hypothetical protein
MANLGRLPPSERDKIRASWNAEAPSWYRPWVHLAFPSLVGLGIVVASLALIRDLHSWQLLMLPVAFVILNAGEWRIHRDVLHKRTPGLRVLYDRHTPLHHMVFVTEDMAIRSPREFRFVLIPAYGIFAAFLGSLPIPLFCGLVLHQWNVALLYLATAMLYTVCYEWLHLSFHLSPESFIGRMRLIAILRRHHAIHHDPTLMQKWNFNVVIPLWDLVRGTIYREESAYLDATVVR